MNNRRSTSLERRGLPSHTSCQVTAEVKMSIQDQFNGVHRFALQWRLMGEAPRVPSTRTVGLALKELKYVPTLWACLP